MSSEPARFAVVGTGWRSQFFLRLAQMAPEELHAVGVVTRTPERAAEVQAQWGVPGYLGLDELLAKDSPEFVVSSVPWAVTPQVVREAVAQRLRVLAETPPAPDADGLRALWADVGGSGLVQVAEQYLLMPGHAARMALLREGVIGKVTSVQVSSTHLYHATSMIRLMLGAGFDPVTVRASRFEAPLANPLSPAGWSGSGDTEPLGTTIATLDFGDGRSGLYDFTDNQWWNPLRARRVVVRGSRGEIVDDSVVRLLDPTTPVESRFARRQLGYDLNLEGVGVDTIAFEGRVLYRNPFPGTRFSDDDLAVATILRDTALWARDQAPAPYPLADGCQDHLLGLAIEESARTGQAVTTAREAWSR